MYPRGPANGIPPGRFQLMDYKTGRSNAHAPKIAVAIALTVAVEQFEVASFMGQPIHSSSAQAS